MYATARKDAEKQRLSSSPALHSGAGFQSIAVLRAEAAWTRCGCASNKALKIKSLTNGVMQLTVSTSVSARLEVAGRTQSLALISLRTKKWRLFKRPLKTGKRRLLEEGQK